MRELILHGVICIVNKTNPRVIESDLAVYLVRSGAAPKPKLVAR